MQKRLFQKRQPLFIDNPGRQSASQHFLPCRDEYLVYPKKIVVIFKHFTLIVNKFLKSCFYIAGICIVACSAGVCQSLSGQWSGLITQSGNTYGNISIEVSIVQNGNAISGEITTTVKNNFIVQQFAGSWINGEILLNERKVLKEVGNLSIG